MSNKKRIEELERRVRELESRPIIYPTIILQPWPVVQPCTPHIVPWQDVPHWQQPWQIGPTIVYSDGHEVIS